jgi:uncharacterized protein YmfQ (DUF2313 family)
MFSEAAARMAADIDFSFYDKSELTQWLFEAIGREYDELTAIAWSFYLQLSPITATWAIGIWEKSVGIAPDSTTPLAVRRNAVMAQLTKRPPLSPYKIEQLAGAFCGETATVTENTDPYTCSIKITATSGIPLDLNGVTALLRRVKPSHITINVAATNSSAIAVFTNFSVLASMVKKYSAQFAF